MLTALGYSTKSAVASIKTAKNVANLEKDFMQIFTSNNMDNILKRFPVLNEIRTFTPGLKADLLGIVLHLNQMAMNGFENVDAIKSKMFEQGRKVCQRLGFV